MSRQLSYAAPPNAKFSRSLRIACVFFACALGAEGQTSPGQAPPPPANPATAASSASAPSDAKKATETPAPNQAVAATDPRQAQIIADSQKLLKLSQELKAEVAKSNKDTLSVTVIKKAEEVEKLAKTLKDEMNKSH